MVNVTWLGHAAFMFKHSGFTFLIDPFLDNPNCPIKSIPVGIDAILITHGHSDHIGSTIEILNANPSCKAYANVEIASYLGKKVRNNVIGFNKGGTVSIGGNFKVTMVDAIHSSDIDTENGIIPGGTPAGFVVKGNGTTFYFSGDTGNLLKLFNIFVVNIKGQYYFFFSKKKKKKKKKFLNYNIKNETKTSKMSLVIWQLLMTFINQNMLSYALVITIPWVQFKLPTVLIIS
jgi:L-ascorbate metabolism protein UlaG (beta-lactamase superfamily)